MQSDALDEEMMLAGLLGVSLVGLQVVARLTAWLLTASQAVLFSMLAFR